MSTLPCVWKEHLQIRQELSPDHIFILSETQLYFYIILILIQHCLAIFQIGEHVVVGLGLVDFSLYRWT